VGVVAVVRVVRVRVVRVVAVVRVRVVRVVAVVAVHEAPLVAAVGLLRGLHLGLRRRLGFVDDVHEQCSLAADAGPAKERHVELEVDVEACVCACVRVRVCMCVRWFGGRAWVRARYRGSSR
jgi:hypothetical protein